MGFLVRFMVSQEGIERKYDSAQNHDRVGHHPGLAPHHVVPRNRRRCHETHRGPHEWRNGHGDRAHAFGYSRHLLYLAPSPIEITPLMIPESGVPSMTNFIHSMMLGPST